VTTEIPDTLHGALVAALTDMPTITTDQTADTGTYKYRYASLAHILDTVRPVLGRHGLAVSQPSATSDAGDLVVMTTVLHRSGSAFTSGELRARMPQTPQQMGSLLSYLRRYQLVALLGLAVEDDDGKSAQDVPLTAGAHVARAQRMPARSELTAPQRSRIMALFGALGLGGSARRDERLAMTIDIIGREIDTTNDVTRDEARQLIDELERRAAAAHEADERYEDGGT
jgi:hypothetical protein